jgi:hypothetical protein
MEYQLPRLIAYMEPLLWEVFDGMLF